VLRRVGASLAATEVDGADWRRYRDVFAARDGETAVVYAVSPTGELWARRQQAAGAGEDDDPETLAGEELPDEEDAP